MNELHVLKVEDLDLTETRANKIVKCIGDFLSELGYNQERIEPLECRSYDGFRAYSHNKGGLGAISYKSQDDAEIEGTGFKNADNALKEYFDYDAETFAKEHDLSTDLDTWSQEDLEKFWNYRQEDSEASVLFSCDVMVTSETELDIRACVCVKDAPYHRQYDDIIKIDIEFKTTANLKQQLKEVLKRDDINLFICNVSEAY